MTKLIATTAAVLGLALAATSAHAQLQLSYPADATMSCDQINAEMVRMDQLMGVSNTNIASAEAGARGAETAASLGVNAALYSGALGRVPGLGMFANAAASQAKAMAAAKAQREAQNIQVAQQRRAIMGGLYQGKCGANAVATPVSATMTTAAPAAMAAAAAPNLLATTQEVSLRGTASPTGAIVGKVKLGGTVYPTGQRNGVWMEVDDENGARGWMSSAFAKPK